MTYYSIFMSSLLFLSMSCEVQKTVSTQQSSSVRPGRNLSQPSQVSPSAPSSVTYFKGEAEGYMSFCFKLDSVKHDPFENDPDMSQGVFVYQEIPSFWSDKGSCSTQLEHNGNYIKTCDGVYLISEQLKNIDSGTAAGDVFTTLTRFKNGRLIVQPIASFELHAVQDCKEFQN